ncbi:BREX system ATP-binding domain-containing protein [Caldicellulosiruptor naganoensis]|uniref:ATP-binding protein n=1 Tax=Caldicellulosiruptor naganoensis TaxID=29324 RepID=A0ABY7BDG1_9FIRM|nr:BREX system ATP-binding domain-containing protein [Caldicellulosiruptor naganoensis]WAM30843.1 ATP-binding protein [Caldicellulosiruptor naganoensis]
MMREDTTFKKLRVIESLRFGLVPEYYIDQLTIGFDQIKDVTEKILRKCESFLPVGFQVCGEYGCGKSHTLSVMRYIARKEGFFTLKVEVDGEGISLSNPSKLLNILFLSIQDNDIYSDYPLVSLFLKALLLKNGSFEKLKRFETIQKYLNVITALAEVGLLDEYSYFIESLLTCSDEVSATDVNEMLSSALRYSGYSNLKLKTLISRKVDERYFDFIEALAGIATLVAAAGYKGLMVTIDEYEVERIKNPSNYKMVQDMLYVIGRYLSGGLNVPRAPLCIIFSAINQGGEKGDPDITRYISKTPENMFEVTKWSESQKIELLKKLHVLYCETYQLWSEFSLSTGENLTKLIESKLPNSESRQIRSIIKWYLTLLDLQYGPPGIRR